MSSIQEIQSNLNAVIQEIKIKGLKAIEIEAVRSIQKNFESGGRPKWKTSEKKGKLKGTKTLRVTGALSQISAQRNDFDSTVTLITNPLARAYEKAGLSMSLREHQLEEPFKIVLRTHVC